MKVNSHQNKVIEITLKFIAKSVGVDGQILKYPDEDERNLSACDVLGIVGSKTVAVEHTSIDSIPFQRRDNSRFMKLLGPVEKELSDKLPTPGHYQLITDMDVMPTGINWNEVRARITEWCLKVAPRLEIGSPSTAPKHFVKEKPQGVPFELALYRWPGRDGQCRIARFSPEDLEEKRTEVILQSLRTRGAKVAGYRNDTLRTILILESNDIALGNASDIGKAFVTAVHKIEPALLPDEVYLAETEGEPYYFHCLKINNTLFPDAIILKEPYKK